MEIPTLTQAKQIAASHNSIRMQEAGRFVLFTYMYVDEAIRQEPNLRGIIYDEHTREVASLPFHKFYNVGEAPDISEDKLEFYGHYSEKLDGSLVQVSAHEGDVIVASRSSVSGYVYERAVPLLVRNLRLMRYIVKHPDTTFLFELLDPENIIVLPQAELKLVFLNARHKTTGEYRYMQHADHIPCEVNKMHLLTPEVWERLKLEMKEDEKREGIVLYLANGDVYKAKTPWYFRLHKLATSYTPVSAVKAWAEDTVDDTAAYLRANGLALHADRMIDDREKLNIAVYVAATDMVNAARDTDGTPKSVATKLRAFFPEGVHAMLFSSVMKTLRSNTLVQEAVVQDFQSNLLQRNDRAKRLAKLVLGRDEDEEDNLSDA